jgi:hypothetical protein
VISRIHQKLGTAGFIVSILALVAALGGGAYAASGGLNGKQKKEVEKIAKKYAGKNGAQGPAGAVGPAGGPGAKGDAGATGPEGKPGGEGQQGKEGKPGKEGSPWTVGGVLPSGKTETGTWTLNSGAVEGQNPVGPISFAIPLAGPLGEGQVHLIGKSGEELIWEFPNAVKEVPPTKCGKGLTPAGTVETPTAAAGNLCVYISNIHSSDNLEAERLGSNLIFDPGQTTECVGIACSKSGPFEGPGAGASQAGAYVVSSTQEKLMVWGSWAVTAP